MLVLKFLRDIKGTFSRFVSVLLIVALGVCFLVGMTTITTLLLDIAYSYYQSNNLSDLWFSGNFTAADLKYINRQDGVTGAAGRIVIDLETKDYNKATLRMYAASDGFSQNSPYIVEGKLIRKGDPRSVMLDSEFARANGILIGDKITLRYREEYFDVIVSAFVKSPELIFVLKDKTSLMPDPKTFGFILCDEAVLGERVFGSKNQYNQITVTVKDEEKLNGIINDSEREIGRRLFGALKREDNMGAYIIESEAQQLTAMAGIFPTTFFLIAAMMLLTTMTRTVKSQRTQIGVLMALGYEKSAVYLSYLAYAFLITAVGGGVGVYLGSLMVEPMMQMYEAYFQMPPYRIYLDKNSIILSFIMAGVFSTAACYYSVRKEITHVPAEALRPEAPKNAHTILLERFGFIWNSLGFSQKIIMRNVFRNRAKFIMSVSGIIGCVVLLLMAFGISDSVNNLIHLQYDILKKYDIRLDFKSNITQAEAKRYPRSYGVSGAEFVRDISVKAYGAKSQRDALLTVTEDVLRLNLIEQNDLGYQALPEDGAITTSRLARKLGIEEGDTVMLLDKATGDEYEVKIAQVSQKMAEDCFLMGESYYRTFGKGFLPSGAYLTFDAAADRFRAIERLDLYDGIELISDKEEIKKGFERSMENMGAIIGFMVFFAGVLAFVVLYNLGTLNFFERMRELATLKVLGFYDHEIKQLVLRENIYFTITGIIIGIPFGIWVLGQMITQENEFINYDMYIAPQTYLLAVGITLMFAYGVNLIIGRRFKKVDMIESLKSVD